MPPAQLDWMLADREGIIVAVSYTHLGTSDGYGAYQSWGNIYLTYNGIDDVAAENYVRDLDIRTAVSSVNYDVNGTHYSREYFVSNPDNVLVARLTAEGGDKLNLDITFPSNQGGTTVAEGDTLLLAGEVSDNQMKYDSVLKAVPEGGEVTADGDTLTVSDADAVTVYVSADTDYKNEYPAYRTGQTAEELHAKVAGTVEAAAEKGFDAVKADHIADYSSPVSYTHLMEKLSSLNQEEQATILMATHDSGAASFCKRILFIQDGVIFHEIRRSDESRQDFYQRILKVMAQLGGGRCNVL